MYTRSDGALDSCRSRIVAAPPDVLSEIVDALQYYIAAANIRVAHAHVINLVSRMARVYSKTSEQRTLWDGPFVPCRKVVLFSEVLL